MPASRCVSEVYMSETSLSDITKGGYTKAIINTRAKNAILSLNEETGRFGLTLTEDEAKELVITRETALRDNARVEFGIGAVKLIIEEFADSPYIDSSNYAQTLNELTDLFYYIKSETDDKISDRDLVEKLKYLYENTCGGSLELLMSRDTDQLIRQINGYSEKADKKYVYKPLPEYFSLGDDINDNVQDNDDDKLLDEDTKPIDEYGFRIIDMNEDDEGLDEGEYSSPRYKIENDYADNPEYDGESNYDDDDTPFGAHRDY